MRKALWILTAVPVIVTAFVLQFMPDEIPMHYNISGEIDRWGSKYECLILPLAIVLFTILWEVLFAVYNKKARNAAQDKQRAETVSNLKVINIIAAAATAVFGVMQCLLLYKQYGEANSGLANLEIDSIKITCLLMGILFIVLGNFISKTKRNGAIGLRIAYSMYNDVTWSKSNRFGGAALMVTGVITVICSALFGSVAALTLMLVFLLASVIVMILYAKKVYETEKQKTEQ